LRRKGQARRLRWNTSHLATAAHPDAESQLQVLAAPHPQALIEGADLHEVVLEDGDGATDQRRAEVRLARLDASLLFVIGKFQPCVAATTLVTSNTWRNDNGE